MTEKLLSSAIDSINPETASAEVVTGLATCCGVFPQFADQIRNKINAILEFENKKIQAAKANPRGKKSAECGGSGGN